MRLRASDLPLAVIGCDFRVASSRWRSLLVLERAEAVRMSRDLRRTGAADGFVELNTCNRNEWIVSGRDPLWAAELLRTQMKVRVGAEALGRIEPYTLIGEEAARHVLRVAIGLESLMVGERQISGQLFRALETARARSTSSRILNGMGTVAGRLVRTAVRRGQLGNSAGGVHSLAVAYLRHRLEPARRARVAVVGIGSIGRRIQGLLETDPRFEPVLLNRTVGPDELGRIRPLDDLAGVLARVDAVVVCTGSSEPVVRPDHLATGRAGAPLLVVDIGIPEQVQRTGLPSGVEVVGLDELTEFHGATGAKNGPVDPAEAEKLVELAFEELQVLCSGPVFSDILDTVQKHHRQLVTEEVSRLVSGRLSYLPEADRERLQQDLRNIVLEYTNEVFRTIKETSKRHVEGVKCRKPR
ncbi:MAG: hypothetical protein HY815_21875 [Candidatus Riflebacteria bacterium]|nr:hypothetical protein [Candidatus Riflebacteria bacterium]